MELFPLSPLRGRAVLHRLAGSRFNRGYGVIRRYDPSRGPHRCLIGFSEAWRDDGTGTKVFWLFFLPLWVHHFNHSTAWFGD